MIYGLVVPPVSQSVSQSPVARRVRVRVRARRLILQLPTAISPFRISTSTKRNERNETRFI